MDMPSTFKSGERSPVDPSQPRSAVHNTWALEDHQAWEALCLE